MAQPWLPAYSGQSIDLVHPVAAQVNFREIAHALARLNRFVGNAATEVSVGLHTLIGYDLCEDRLKPWWLLHDAHEARLGDVATPVGEAEGAVAAELFGGGIAEQLAAARKVLVDRHDRAIHAAAGLPLPDAAAREALFALDLVTLATERRDFLVLPPKAIRRPWAIDEMGVEALGRRWRFLAPADVTDRLHALFVSHLPALRTGVAA